MIARSVSSGRPCLSLYLRLLAACSAGHGVQGRGAVGRSTDQRVLEKHQHQHPIVRLTILTVVAPWTLRPTIDPRQPKGSKPAFDFLEILPTASSDEQNGMDVQSTQRLILSYP